MKTDKYIKIIIHILIYVILIVKFRAFYLNQLFSLIEYYYSKKIKIIGKDNIPKTNGYIIISNHNFITEAFLIKHVFTPFDI